MRVLLARGFAFEPGAERFEGRSIACLEAILERSFGFALPVLDKLQDRDCRDQGGGGQNFERASSMLTCSMSKPLVLMMRNSSSISPRCL